MARSVTSKAKKLYSDQYGKGESAARASGSSSNGGVIQKAKDLYASSETVQHVPITSRMEPARNLVASRQDPIKTGAMDLLMQQNGVQRNAVQDPVVSRYGPVSNQVYNAIQAQPYRKLPASPQFGAKTGDDYLNRQGSVLVPNNTQAENSLNISGKTGHTFGTDGYRISGSQAPKKNEITSEDFQKMLDEYNTTDHPQTYISLDNRTPEESARLMEATRKAELEPYMPNTKTVSIGGMTATVNANLSEAERLRLAEENRRKEEARKLGTAQLFRSTPGSSTSIGAAMFPAIESSGNPKRIDPGRAYNLDGVSEENRALAALAASQIETNPLMAAELEAQNSPGSERAKQYTYMTDEEKQHYNELFGVRGYRAAEDYHNMLLDDINARIAKDIYENEQKNWSGGRKTAYQYGRGLESGVRGLTEAGNAFLGVPNSKATPISEYLGQETRSDQRNSKTMNVMLDIAQSTGNMTPGMAAGFLTGGAGDVVFALSQYGNSYKEAINNGEDTRIAQIYAAQQGVDETLTNFLLGGIQAFGGGAIKKAIKGAGGEAFARALDRVCKSEAGKKVLSRVLDYISDMGGEAAQEYLQFYTENWTKALLGMKDEEGNPIKANFNLMDPDALYSALLGALNAGVLNAAPAAMNTGRAATTRTADARATAEMVKQELDAGNFSDETKDTAQQLYDIAQQIAEKQESGKKASVIDRIGYSAAEEDLKNAIIQEKVAEGEKKAREAQAVYTAGRNYSDDAESILQGAESLTDDEKKALFKQGRRRAFEEGDIRNEAEAVQDRSDLFKEQGADTLSSEYESIYRMEDGADLGTFDQAARRLATATINEVQNGTSEASDRATAVYKETVESGALTIEQADRIVEAALKDGNSIKQTRLDMLAEAKETLQARAENNSSRMSDEATQAMIDAYDNVGAPVEKYAQAFEAYYDAGLTGQSMETVNKTRNAVYLTDEVKQLAYEQGAKNQSADGALTQGEAREGGLAAAAESASESQKKAGETIGEMTGLKIQLTTEGDSQYDSRNGTISININKTDNFNQTMAHELTHFIQDYSAQYRKFRTMAIQALMESRQVDYNTLYQSYADAYVEEYGKIDREAILDEMTADAAGEFLNDEKFAQQVVKTNRKLGNRIYNFVTDIADALKELIDTGSIRAAAKALRENLEYYRSAQAVWASALGEASEAYKSGETIEAQRDVVKFEKHLKDQIRDANELLSGMPPIGSIPLKSFSGMNNSDKIDIAVHELGSDNQRVHRDGFGDVIIDRRRIKESLAYVPGVDPGLSNTLSAIKFIPDIIKKGEQIDHHEAHKDIPSIKESWTFAAPVLIGGNRNNMAVVVRLTDDHYFRAFMVRTMEESKSKGAVTETAAGNTEQRTGLAPKNNITSPSLEINTKKQLDLGEPIEQTRNLVAMHNMTSYKLRQALKYEGLPMPSIAITKADIGHENFGPISFVFRKETIDPKRKQNKVYSADAWTPTFPRIEYQANENAEKRLSEKFYGLSDKYGRDAVDALYNYGVTLEESLNRYDGVMGILEKEEQNPRMAQAYLYDTGKGDSIPKPETKIIQTRVPMNERAKAVADFMIQNLGEEAIRNEQTPLSRFKDSHEAYLREVMHYPAEEAANKVDRNPATLYETLAKRARAVLNGETETLSERTETDYSKRDAFLKETLQTKEYKAWLNDLFKDAEGTKGIRNGKDLYTPSGNRRSFASTHYEVTAANIVRSMLDQSDGKSQNTSGFVAGIKSLRSSAAEQFRTLEDIRKAAENLKTTDTETYQEISDQLQDVLYQSLSEIKKRSGDFFETQSLGEILIEAIEKRRTSPEALRKHFYGYQYVISEIQARKLSKLVEDVKALPVNMFEAKPERVVGWDEIAAAVVPNDLEASLKNALTDKGVKIVEYDPQIDGDRKSKVNGLDNVRFQLNIERAGKVSKAQEKRDRGEMLSEKQFYQIYSAHKLNLRGADNLQEQIDNIKAEGFKGFGGFGNNVVPASINPRGYTEQEMMDKGYSQNDIDWRKKNQKDKWRDGRYYPSINVVQGKYGARKGDTVMFVSEADLDVTKDTQKVKYGHKPFDYEIVTVERDFQPYYELYKKAYEENTPDIRKQLNVSEESAKNYGLLLESSPQLQKASRDLAEMFKRTDYMPSQSDIKNIAKTLRDETGSKMGQKKLEDALRSYYNWIHYSDQVDGAEAMSIAMDIAGQLISDSDSVYNEQEVMEYNDLRRMLRSTRQKPILITDNMIAELGGKEDFNAIRKSLWGTMYFTTDKTKGESIDSFYTNVLKDSNLSYRFTEDSDAGQLMDILEKLETMRPKKAVSDEDYEVYQLETAQKLFDAYFNVEYNPQAAAITGYKQAAAEAVADYKRTMNERYSNYKELMKDRYKTWKENRLLKQKNREAMNELLKKARRLNRMKKKGTPEFQAQVDALIGQLDLVAPGISTKTQEKLRALYNEVNAQSEADPYYKDYQAPKYKDLFARLTADRIADMSMEEIQQLTESIVALEHSKRTADREIREEAAQKFATQGRDFVAQQRNVKGVNRGAWMAPVAKYGLKMLNPVRAMAMMDGYQRDGVLTHYAKELNDGQTKAAMFRMKVEKMFHDIDQNHDLVKDFAKQNIEIDTMEGKKKISKGMRIALYLHAQNLENVKHIAYGGITIPNERLYRKGKYQEAYNAGETVHFAPWNERGDSETAKAILEDICSKMTPEELEYARIAQQFFNEVSKEAINETSLQLDGYEKAIVEKYFPIRSNKNFLQQDMSGLVQNGTIEGMGMLKERTGAGRNPILLEDVAQVVMRQKNNTAAYYGLAIPLRNFNRFYNYTSTQFKGSAKDAVAKTWNTTGLDYIENMVNDLQFGRQTKRTKMDMFKSLYAGAALNLNLGVAIKQTASYPFAASVIGWEPIIKSAGKVFKKADYDYMDSITPWGYMRRQGMSGTEMGEVFKQRNDIENSQAFQKFKRAVDWIGKVDVKTTDTLFFAAEEYVKQHNPDLKVRGEEYNQKVAEVYNDVLQRTQPSYDVMQRNEFLRDTSDVTKIFGMFKTQTFNMGGEIIDAYGRWRATAEMLKRYNPAEIDEVYEKIYGTEENRKKREDKLARLQKEAKDARKQFANTIAATVASQAMLAVLAAVANAALHKMKPYRDDDGEVTPESLFSKIGMDFLTSFPGMLMFGNEVKSLALALSGKEKWYDLDYPPLELINGIATASVNFADALRKEIQTGRERGEWRGEDLAKAEQKLAKLLMEGLKLKKIPAQNIYNIANAAWLWAQDIKNGELGTFNAGEGLLGISDTSVTQKQYAQQAVNAYAQGDVEKGDRAAAKVSETQIQNALAVEGDKDENGKTITNSKKYNTVDEILTYEGSDEAKGKLYAAAYPSDALTEWTNKGKSPYDFMLGTKLAGEMADKDIPSDEQYAYVVDSKDYTPDQKVAWLLSDKQKTGGQKYQAWKEIGGSDWDYIKYRADLSRFKGDGKQAKIVEYIKKATENEKKRRALWELAGYKESTYDKKMK